ncbi:hypothetical protein AX17_002070 [Amanita inopinata Kibby_2008]|nr:hypothetical protein AX17_002070 [Amanita inopinata Kibby_2008]
MVFQFFSRKPRPSLEQSELEAPKLPEIVQGIDATHEAEAAAKAPESPNQATPQITEPTALYALILSVPSQILHTYCLDRLAPNNTEPPSPKTLTALTSFLTDLAPPPRLHCVRCHKSYFEVENTGRSCLVPHDDESAEVERVSKVKGLASEYETLWGCCGRTVEGDGDMGPPDGWCYEGKHTTDAKRARFRADSNPNDDKLVPCSRLRCPGSSRQLLSPSPSSTLSNTARVRRKRSRPSEHDVEGDEPSSQSDAENSRSSPKRRRRTKSTSARRKSINAAVAELKEGEKADENKGDAMDVDPPAAPASTAKPKPLRARKTKAGVVADGNESSHSSPSVRPRPKPTSRKSKASADESGAATTETSPKSRPNLKQRASKASLRHKPNNSVISVSSEIAAKSQSPSGTKRVAYVEVPACPKNGGSNKVTDNERGEGCGKRNLTRMRTKGLADIVDTSVDGENA